MTILDSDGDLTVSAQGHVVDLNERALDAAFPRLIVDGLAMQAEGWVARRQAVLDLAAQGLLPGKISAELARRARAAGYGDEHMRSLGISEHNVRVILRKARRQAAAA